MLKRLITIGHICEDLIKGRKIIGGGVLYSGITAKELGYDVHIVTKLPANYTYQNSFLQPGIFLHNLQTENKSMTTLVLYYDNDGRRKLKIAEKQDDIMLKDLKQIDTKLLDESLFLIAPIIGEVQTSVIKHLAHYGIVVLTPQGYFRRANKEKVLLHKKWPRFEEDLRHASITILSEEDMVVEGVLNINLLEKIIVCSRITVLTRGKEGATIFEKGRRPIEIHAFPLKKNEIKDLTGAGDTFASAFTIRYISSGSLHEAGVFACLYAAIKIASKKIGITTIPSLVDLHTFIINNSTRVKEYLNKNNFHSNIM